MNNHALLLKEYESKIRQYFEQHNKNVKGTLFFDEGSPTTLDTSASGVETIYNAVPHVTDDSASDAESVESKNEESAPVPTKPPEAVENVQVGSQLHANYKLRLFFEDVANYSNTKFNEKRLHSNFRDIRYNHMWDMHGPFSAASIDDKEFCMVCERWQHLYEHHVFIMQALSLIKTNVTIMNNVTFAGILCCNTSHNDFNPWGPELYTSFVTLVCKLKLAAAIDRNDKWEQQSQTKTRNAMIRALLQKIKKISSMLSPAALGTWLTISSAQ